MYRYRKLDSVYSSCIITFCILVARTSTKEDTSTDQSNLLLGQISESPILGIGSLDVDESHTEKETEKDTVHSNASLDLFDKSTDEINTDSDNQKRKCVSNDLLNQRVNKEDITLSRDIVTVQNKTSIANKRRDSESNKIRVNDFNNDVNKSSGISETDKVQTQEKLAKRTVQSENSTDNRIQFTSFDNRNESHEHIPTFLELKKRLELQNLEGSTTSKQNSIGELAKLDNELRKIGTLRDSTSDSLTSSGESRGAKDSDFDASTIRKARKFRKKRKKRCENQLSSNISDKSSDHEKDALKFKKLKTGGKSKTEEQLIQDASVEEAKASVLASTSEEDSIQESHDSVADYNKKASQKISSPEGSSSDAHESLHSNLKHNNISPKQSLNDRLDVNSDIKLKQKVSVKLDCFPLNILSVIHQNSINVLNHPILSQHTVEKRHRHTVPICSSKVDSEVDRLCDLKPLESSINVKNQKSEKIKDEQKVKSDSTKNKLEKNTNTLKSPNIMSSDGDVEAQSSQETDEEMKKDSNCLKNGMVSKMSATELARLAVLDTSSSGSYT